MKYLAVLVATRWGSSLGGINVFNTGLASGIASALRATGQCVCFVEEMPDSSVPQQGFSDLHVFSGEGESAVEEITSRLLSDYLSAPSTELLILGHDVKTGKLAVDVAKRIRTLAAFKVRSATVSHMDYVQYAGYKGRESAEVTKLFTEQRNLVASADLAFAVGPLLQQSFQSARAAGPSDGSQVAVLIPGSPLVKPEPLDESGQLRVFISGRLGGEDDAIKNGRLAMLALTDAYATGRSSGAPRWKSRGMLTAMGVDKPDDIGIERKEADAAARYFRLEALPYTDNQADILQHLKMAHIAMMPSWHEGFGLTGWEALCCGVPLICSMQSGLAQFLWETANLIPDFGLESILFVDLVGMDDNGEPSTTDRDALSDALLRMVKDYKYRKYAALKLAKRLNTDFTWLRCANDLLKHCGWTLSTSVLWSDRQEVAASSPKSDDVSEDELIDNAIYLSADDNGLSQWEEVCTALNTFSNRGKSAAKSDKPALSGKLENLCENLDRSFAKIPMSTAALPTRETGRLDVCWRLMAAAASVATTFSSFCSFLKRSIEREICEDSFLRREYFHYACKFSGEFNDRAENLAREKFSLMCGPHASDATLQVRLARLCTIFPTLQNVIPTYVSAENAFQVEYQSCMRLQSTPWKAIELIEKEPSLSASLLAISALKSASNAANIGHVLAFVEHYHGPLKPSWRGDKRLKAALLTASVNPEVVLEVLRGLAQDEEEAVRWAAIDIIFSPMLRQRLAATVASDEFEQTTRHIVRRLGEIVDIAVMSDGAHPWLQREFITLYANEHRNHRVQRNLAFTLDDFPRSRWLFGPSPDSLDKAQRTLHPEVLEARAAANSIIKRVLLVLPPIAFSENSDEPSAARTTTPPLGLGLIASHLATLGHDVYIADCHRFPALTRNVLTAARFFDVVGFNVVISTIRSSYRMMSHIKQDAALPAIVVGGPVPNLGAWAYAAQSIQEKRCWDFQIRSGAEENMARLVASIEGDLPWHEWPGVFANQESSLVAARGLASTRPSVLPDVPVSHEWKPLTMLDRRVFKGPSGYYEPNTTRATERGFHEAHVVMSRGCDWNCPFCTERKQLSSGEKRREVSDVIAEIRELTLSHPGLRIQFIDDNLLPQIAAPGNDSPIRKTTALEWTRAFLHGMTSLRQQSTGTLGWRGIFRLEDFLEYERELSDEDFIGLLIASGCRMLAFGVEHGNEEKRKKLKTSPTVSNDDIVSVFARLRSRGIHTKAYFMLGGWNETRKGMSETIDFALRCGATLAYFALFKDFVEAVRALHNEWTSDADGHARFLNYKQHYPDWDSLLQHAFCDAPKDASVAILSNVMASPFSESEMHDASTAYTNLSVLGFSFKDLVKYNDYHSDEGSAGTVLAKLTGGPVDEYLSVVNEAYLRFYLRLQFVQDYQALVADGY